MASSSGQNSHEHRRVALVTGASRGLGAAIARMLAARHARVAVNYAHSEKEAAAVAEGIRAAGGEALPFKADVRSAADVQALLQAVERTWGPVEILVNNATGPQPMLPLEQYEWRHFQDQLDFFVKAPVLLMQAALPAMKEAHWGRVINIGSEVTELGNADFSAYVAAKAALAGLTRAWATEFGPHGITVNLIAPGWIPVERHAGIEPQAFAAYAAGVPLGRMGTPQDVAAAAAFLAGEEAGFITGQCLAVNGGNTF